MGFFHHLINNGEERKECFYLWSLSFKINLGGVFIVNHPDVIYSENTPQTFNSQTNQDQIRGKITSFYSIGAAKNFKYHVQEEKKNMNDSDNFNSKIRWIKVLSSKSLFESICHATFNPDTNQHCSIFKSTQNRSSGTRSILRNAFWKLCSIAAKAVKIMMEQPFFNERCSLENPQICNVCLQYLPCLK